MENLKPSLKQVIMPKSLFKWIIKEIVSLS
jgi:hypothetical protein